MNVRVYSAPASLWDRLEHIGTMPARERERERKRDVVEEVGWRHAEIASASKLTHVPSISMKYSLLSQPSCLRMWLCWTLLFLPVKKEQLGARLSWREKIRLGIWHSEIFWWIPEIPTSSLPCMFLHQWCGRFLPWPQGMELLKSFHQRQLSADVFWRLTWGRICGGWRVM